MNLSYKHVTVWSSLWFIPEYKWSYIVTAAVCGVLTISRKAHFTKNRSTAFTCSFQRASVFQFRREESHLTTVSLGSGLHDRYCLRPFIRSTKWRTVSPVLSYPQKVPHRVNRKPKRIVTVAGNLESNSFFSCFMGPIKSSYWLLQQYSPGNKTLWKVSCHWEAIAIQFQGEDRKRCIQSLCHAPLSRCWN